MMRTTSVLVMVCAMVLASCAATSAAPTATAGIALSDINANNVTINIHLKLDAATAAMAQSYDAQLHALLPSDDIWLRGQHEPHITLYLTAFQIDTTLDALLATLNEGLGLVSSQMQRCQTVLTDTFASGTFGMWRVVNDSCIQLQSDLIVDTFFKYAVKNQPIPDWVYTLPEPIRSEKIRMIELYGSPNVFSQFDPHVTLAFDGKADTENLAGAMASLNNTKTWFYPSAIALGSVGNYGTVLRGRDMGNATIPV